VATTTQLADLARNVAGSRARVTGILAANADPHDYEVRPSDVEGLVGASLVLRSGGDLDAWLAEAVAGAGGSPKVVTLSDHVRRRRGPDGKADPHWWQDPRNAAIAVRAIRDALAAVDPPGASEYSANARRYLARLAALDRSVTRCMEAIPAARRQLVTTHDALGYYAARYGIKVIGAVIPSLSTRAQASAGQTRALIDQIRRTGVGAIFAEESVNSKVEAAIARESGARIGRALYADTLGPAGSPGATYIGSIRANTAALADGFTDGSRTC
jgi:ABC-type Zn uptake system ZnuABC Zn-binding protein ZnuA